MITYAKLPPDQIYNGCDPSWVWRVARHYQDTWWEEHELRAQVRAWFIELFEHYTGGHYSRLRASIAEHGIRYPIIVTSGAPRRRERWMLPPDYAFPFICEQNGGSRLMIAQELGMPVPCVINGPGGEEIDIQRVREIFGSEFNVSLHQEHGVMTSPVKFLHLPGFDMAQQKWAQDRAKSEIVRRLGL